MKLSLTNARSDKFKVKLVKVQKHQIPFLLKTFNYTQETKQRLAYQPAHSRNLHQITNSSISRHHKKSRRSLRSRLPQSLIHHCSNQHQTIRKNWDKSLFLWRPRRPTQQLLKITLLWIWVHLKSLNTERPRVNQKKTHQCLNANLELQVWRKHHRWIGLCSVGQTAQRNLQKGKALRWRHLQDQQLLAVEVPSSHQEASCRTCATRRLCCNRELVLVRLRLKYLKLRKQAMLSLRGKALHRSRITWTPSQNS